MPVIQARVAIKVSLRGPRPRGLTESNCKLHWELKDLMYRDPNI